MVGTVDSGPARCQRHAATVRKTCTLRFYISRPGALASRHYRHLGKASTRNGMPARQYNVLEEMSSILLTLHLTAVGETCGGSTHSTSTGTMSMLMYEP